MNRIILGLGLAAAVLASCTTVASPGTSQWWKATCKIEPGPVEKFPPYSTIKMPPYETITIKNVSSATHEITNSFVVQARDGTEQSLGPPLYPVYVLAPGQTYLIQYFHLPMPISISSSCRVLEG